VYVDEFTGLKQVSTGILTSDFTVLRAGDGAYKAAQKRAQTIFEDSLRPLFDRAGFDVDAFRQALAF
jgi:hypothetical protein